MKHLFIVNPVAGGRDQTRYVSEKASQALAGRESYEIYVTQRPLDAWETVQAAARTGDPLRIYACGGDGTLNECVNGAAGFKNASVTHFPCGTGNDFVKMFGSESRLFSNLNQLVGGFVREIDLIECNGRYSVNICSVGIDARIGTDVHKYRGFLKGMGAYLVSTLVNLVKGINSPMRIAAGDHLFQGSFALVCACNGRFYGGGFNPVPCAVPDDGLLDFLIVKGVSRLAFIRLVGKYAKGKFAQLPEVITHVRGPLLTIQAQEEMVVNLDGEAIHARGVRFKVSPGAVRFIFPEKLRFFETRPSGSCVNRSTEEISLEKMT